MHTKCIWKYTNSLMDGINLHVGSVSLIMLIRVLIVIWLWRIQPRASTSFSHTVSFTFVTRTIPFLFAKAKPNTNHGYDQVDSETYERVGIERNRPLDWKRATAVKWSVVFWESRNLNAVVLEEHEASSHVERFAWRPSSSTTGSTVIREQSRGCLPFGSIILCHAYPS